MKKLPHQFPSSNEMHGLGYAVHTHALLVWHGSTAAAPSISIPAESPPCPKQWMLSDILTSINPLSILDKLRLKCIKLTLE